MEEESQKSIKLSHVAKFIHEVVRCTEKRETAKPLQFLELMKGMPDWQKHKAAIGECEES
jgi:hypothetical protein